MKGFKEHQIEPMPRICIRMTHSKKKLRKWCDSIGTDPEPIFERMETADAVTTSLINYDGRLLFLVWMNDSLKRSAATDAALLAHEATHVMQEYFSYLGENHPGEEAQAYVTQSATGYLVEEHYAWKQRKFDKRKKGC